jgi:DNA polymerase
VPGEGPENARVLFIGEAPGWHENQQGRPFVGPAGQFLDQLLASIGWKREDVYITNVVKCRPPENRDPLPEEITACAPYLDQQIAILKPRLIVTLGRYSMAKWFPNESISKIHGLPRRFGQVVVVPMYHPAAALHQPKYRADIEADFAKLPSILAEADTIPSERGGETEESPQQLSLF